MNEQREKLSTLMDDFEHTEQDQTQLKELLGDVNQQYIMRRYQMIGEVMRNELPQTIQPDFVSSVMSKIEQEPALHIETPAKVKTQDRPSWFWSVLFKPVAGLAVAATVAVVAVSNIQLQSVAVDQPEQLASNASVNPTSDRVAELASISFVNQGGAARVSVNGQSSVSAGTNWKIKQSAPDIQKKLNVYLINHNEFSNSWQGIIPQVRVVGFDAQK
ncbi:MAG: hypothetical protein KAU21_01440 [Gammaproteobacteria bacterium]|nr:hypothetical protein [Gammaproteobacteria bacterium]